MNVSDEKINWWQWNISKNQDVTKQLGLARL